MQCPKEKQVCVFAFWGDKCYILPLFLLPDVYNCVLKNKIVLH